MNERPDLFVAAGEPSGDLIASLLIRQLHQINPALKITGIGGDQMAEAGAEIRFNIVRDLAIIGVSDILSNLGKLRRLFQDTIHCLRRRPPRALVLIDYPGFNLRLAAAAHAMGIPVVYYVVPQVWAWHKSRIHKIRRTVDAALVVLPFEEQFYRDAGIEARYVGHPLLDTMKITMSREQVFEHFKLDPGKKVIGLLPGSRPREIELLLQPMLEGARIILGEMSDAQFILPRASSAPADLIQSRIDASGLDVKVTENNHDLRSVCDFAIVASGTATLETGLLGTPMVVVYKVSSATWHLSRLVLKIPHIGLINIVAGRKIVPELVQHQCTPQNIANESLTLLRDRKGLESMRLELGRVREQIGGPGASRRAAEIIHDLAMGPLASRTLSSGSST